MRSRLLKRGEVYCCALAILMHVTKSSLVIVPLLECVRSELREFSRRSVQLEPVIVLRATMLTLLPGCVGDPRFLR